MGKYVTHGSQNLYYITMDNETSKVLKGGRCTQVGLYFYFWHQVLSSCTVILDGQTAVKRRSSDSFSSDSPVKKIRRSFSSPITPPDSDKSVQHNNNSASTPEESPEVNSMSKNV